MTFNLAINVNVGSKVHGKVPVPRLEDFGMLGKHDKVDQHLVGAVLVLNSAKILPTVERLRVSDD